MTKPISYRDKCVLIVDDMADMRSSLRSQVGSLDIQNVSVAANIRDALELLAHKRFDVILCDYYLGGPTDGQQFLEYLRTGNLIKRAVNFIMITAETGYESVITAAECLPDDYLLKPFTAETLRSRFARLIERKLHLQKIDQLHDQCNWSAIIDACDEMISRPDKYLIDAMRIKGNALLMADRHQEAILFYERVISQRKLPWARLGLARAMKGNGQFDFAKQLLNELINDAPQLLSAYDLLGKIHAEKGDDAAAISILEKAGRVAPNSLNRQRSIVELAEKNGDFQRVESILTSVLKKTKNSPLRNPADYAKLSNAYLEMNDLQKAGGIIDEANINFKDTGTSRALSAVEAQVRFKTGQPELAQQALAKALEGGTNDIADELACLIAKACLVNGKPDAAEGIVKHLLQNNPDSAAVVKAVSDIYKNHGGEEATKILIEQSAQEVVKLNNEAVVKAKSGGYAEAAQMLTEAAFRLPNNLQIVANAAVALLADVFMNQFDIGKLRQAKSFAKVIEKANKEHPKLKEVAHILQKIQSKYPTESRS
ncbi:response regulator [Undibacterium sp. RuRC25W]|uniref:response regulator n=1 Tax=Undibacterium sp. RuRC25W TaxID=3413047 RepID=UPI003BF452D2